MTLNFDVRLNHGVVIEENIRNHINTFSRFKLRYRFKNCCDELLP